MNIKIKNSKIETYDEVDIDNILSKNVRFDDIESKIDIILNKNDYLVKDKVLYLDYTGMLFNIIKKDVYGYECHKKVIKTLGVLNRKFHNNNGQIVNNNSTMLTSGFSLKSSNVYRFGNVELRVLHCFLFNSLDEIRKAFNKVFNQKDNEDYLYSTISKRDNWLSSDDIEFNLKRLITNAGFYFSDEIEDSWNHLIFFCNSYLKALIKSTHILSQAEFYPYFFRIANSINNSFDANFNLMKVPSHVQFYKELEGKKILFVTSFHEQINDLFNTGDIFKLFKDYTPNYFQIFAIPSYISTYPNKPHKSFLETADVMIRDIDEAFSQNDYDIFISSCGAYGSLLSNHVRENYNCSTLYQGNMSNTLFGIKQKTNENYATDKKDLRFWRESDLSKYKNVSKIDGGRYI